jgi:hypothetical protein
VFHAGVGALITESFSVELPQVLKNVEGAPAVAVVRIQVDVAGLAHVLVRGGKVL